MPTKNLLAAGLGAAALCVLAGCGGTSSHTDPAPASLKAIPGSPVKEVQLTPRAEQRLGITTQPVRAASVGPSLPSVPPLRIRTSPNPAMSIAAANANSWLRPPLP